MSLKEAAIKLARFDRFGHRGPARQRFFPGQVVILAKHNTGPTPVEVIDVIAEPVHALYLSGCRQWEPWVYRVQEIDTGESYPAAGTSLSRPKGAR